MHPINQTLAAWPPLDPCLLHSSSSAAPPTASSASFPFPACLCFSLHATVTPPTHPCIVCLHLCSLHSSLYRYTILISSLFWLSCWSVCNTESRLTSEHYEPSQCVLSLRHSRCWTRLTSRSLYKLLQSSWSSHLIKCPFVKAFCPCRLKNRDNSSNQQGQNNLPRVKNKAWTPVEPSMSMYYRQDELLHQSHSCLLPFLLHKMITSSVLMKRPAGKHRTTKVDIISVWIENDGNNQSNCPLWVSAV